MDREIQANLEDHLHVLGCRKGTESGAVDPRVAGFREKLSRCDEETRRTVRQFEDTAEMIRQLRCPDEVAPSPGFYARVMEGISARRQSSVWSLFLDPQFSQRLMLASAALLILLGLTLFSTPVQDEAIIASAPAAPEFVMADEDPLPVNLVNESDGRDQMLSRLATYQE
jgi:hypothetical protein